MNAIDILTGPAMNMLYDSESFQQQISAWQRNTPTQEEVEDTLEGYAELAHTPVLVH